MNFNQIFVYLVNSWNGIISDATSVVQTKCLSILSIIIYHSFSVYVVGEWVMTLGWQRKGLDIWPSREIIDKNMPEDF